MPARKASTRAAPSTSKKKSSSSTSSRVTPKSRYSTAKRSSAVKKTATPGRKAPAGTKTTTPAGKRKTPGKNAERSAKKPNTSTSKATEESSNKLPGVTARGKNTSPLNDESMKYFSGLIESVLPMVASHPSLIVSGKDNSAKMGRIEENIKLCMEKINERLSSLQVPKSAKQVDYQKLSDQVNSLEQIALLSHLELEKLRKGFQAQQLKLVADQQVLDDCYTSFDKVNRHHDQLMKKKLHPVVRDIQEEARDGESSSIAVRGISASAASSSCNQLEASVERKLRKLLEAAQPVSTLLTDLYRARDLAVEAGRTDFS